MILRHSVFAAILVACPVRVADKVEVVAEGYGDDLLKTPFAVDFDRSGMVIADLEGNRVWRADRNGKLSVLAGTGEKGDSGDNGPAAAAKLNGPHHLLIGPAGTIYVADTFNNRVRKIDPKTGVISAFAGTGKSGFSGDGGPAAEAQMGGVYCIAFNRAKDRMYLDDLDNRRIRMVDMKTGIVTTFAGNGKKGVPTDGAMAVESPLFDPRAVAMDSKGKLYILERSGNALRVVGPAGKIRTVAGTGKPGLTGDGGEAILATLKGPKHICIDRDDTVLIADSDNHVVRRYNPGDGRIVRVAGTGVAGAGGVGGAPEHVELNEPHGVYIDKSGVLFISDSSNRRVLRVR